MSSCDNCTNPITIDVALFRMKFPAFADPLKFPDLLIESMFDDATAIASACDNLCFMLHGKSRVRALYLLTAHLLYLSLLSNKGLNPGFVESATIDKVSVSRATPPVDNNFQFWLSESPYGQQLLALLEVKTAGGTYIGGSPELLAFRKVGGFFW